MAHGYLSPQDIRGNVDYLGMIGSAIGSRVKKASDMARAERKNATTQLGKQLNSEGKKGTLADKGMEGRGYFFKRALGSTFGGDKIARTRGRFETDPPGGRDPSKTQAGRFRAGFDYGLSGPTAIQRTGGGDDGVQGVNVQDLGPSGGSGPSGSGGGGLANAFGGAVKGIGGLLAPAASAITPEVLPPVPAGSFGGGGAAGSLSAPAIDTTATEIKDVVITLSKISALIAQSGNQTTQAIADSTRTTQQGFMSLAQMQLSISNRELAQQKQLAAAAQDQQEKMFARQLAAAEAAKTGQGGDYSDGITPEAAGQGPLGRLGGMFGGAMDLLGNGLDMIGGRYMNRGPDVKRQKGARRRLARMRSRGAARGIGRGAKGLTGMGGKLMHKGLQKTGVKIAGKGLGKGLAKGLAKGALKKIPGVGLIAGLGFGIERLMKGDLLGAGLELASGAASTVPGLGTAGSIGIDAALMARDAGVTPFATGGIVEDATLGLVGEKGREGVFPLEGEKGRKTFLMFGEGILEAQKKRRSDYAALQASGLSHYFERQDGWKGFFDFLGKMKDAVTGPLSALASMLGLGGGNPRANPNGNFPRTPGGGSVDAPDLKTAIRRLESGNDYSSMFSRDRGDFSRGTEDITKMTIDQVHDLQTDYLRHQASKGYGPKQRSAAMGAYQMMEVKAVAQALGIDTSTTLFDKATQDKMSEYYLNIAGYQDWKAGKITDAQFNDRLAGQFASVKQTSGRGAYDNDGMNNAYGNIMPVLQKEKERLENPPPPETPDLDTTSTTPTNSQKITRNFGFKTGQRLYFTHNGGYYHGYKTKNGWDIYKGMVKIDTNEKNQAVIDALISAGEAHQSARKPNPITAPPAAPVDPAAAPADILTPSASNAAAAQKATLNPVFVFQPTAQTSSAGAQPSPVAPAMAFSSSGTSLLSLLSYTTKQ